MRRKAKPATVKALEELGRVRLSRSFYLREFLYSEISNFHGIPNLPDDPDLHRFRASDQLVDVAEDQLALPSRIGRRHDPGDFVAAEDSSDDLELITSLFVDDQGPLARQQREQIPPPTTPGRIDFVGFGERDKVADGPRHDVSVAVLEPLATPVGAQDLGNVSCNGGLLGEDRRGLA